ncbi:Exoenzymes regulatory protein AepA in lipid-linked oligosaccharide synthesis cluster [Alkalibacterium sp. AK22]|uniref:amidohydrolase n=1 Tax=Alkalibacterium sp. AK22 TaxID=1229520 RepID=UPI000445EAB9|nr:amidohydrolase [Alkalibacterium sp. AK22]EXJ23612.1 Exoenzymes regulatory protein AepA in lipid-linked oligosaccharide synthesis cluster [Alkalibacterium sp. AK22]
MKWFKNGKIYLEEGQFVDSMIVDANTIIWTGESAACSYSVADSEIIDLEGRTVLPGLIDSHLHFLMTAEHLSMLPITGVTALNELVKRCEEYIKDRQLTAGDILYSEGWNHTLFTDKQKIPDRHDLDRASTEVPIVLVRVDRHMMSLNSAALKYFEINETTIPETGGEIYKDSSGQPTGVLTEGALDLIKAKLPEASRSEQKAALKNAMALANQYGITSMHTNDAKDDRCKETLSLYEELEAEGQLTVRFYQQIWFNNGKYLPAFLASGYRFQSGSDWNKIGPIKFFIDGTLGSRTAALRAPYTDDPTTSGVLTKSQEELTAEVRQAVEHGYQVITHGIGDRGIDYILNAYDTALNNQANDLRLGINHMQITDKELIDHVAERGYLTYVQPIFLDDDLLILDDRVGKERARQSYLFKSMINKGVHQSFSSDAPVVSFDPFKNIQCAVTRNRLTAPLSKPYLPDQAVSVAQAIDAYTYEGAYASFDEHKKGRLKPGFLADFCVLDCDIFTVSHDCIKDTTVHSTYVDGQLVYAKGGR